MIRRFSFAYALLLTLMLGVCGDAWAVEYQVRFLNMPPGFGMAWANDINDRGQVVGAAYDLTTTLYGVFWDTDGSTTVINCPPGTHLTNNHDLELNSLGQVVGSVYNPSTRVTTAFLWSKSDGMTFLGTPPYGKMSVGTGINDHGQIVGRYTGPNGSLPFTWTADTGMIPLGSAGGHAQDINNLGQIAGAKYPSGRATIWNSDGSFKTLEPLPGYSWSDGYCINDKGQVAGLSYGTSNNYVVTFWDADGTPTKIVTPSDWFPEAVGMNEAGQVVVNSPLTSHTSLYGFLWSNETGTIKLSLPGDTYECVGGINNLGQIAGYGFDLATHSSRACIWTPVVPNHAPDCSASAPSIAEIWLPSGQMVAVNIQGVTDPDGDEVTIAIDAITQDEPVAKGGLAPDGDGIGSDTAWLRAERMGGGNGRVYAISFTATDTKGASAKGTAKVMVPHDQRKDSVCVDDGQIYDSTKE